MIHYLDQYPLFEQTGEQLRPLDFFRLEDIPLHEELGQIYRGDLLAMFTGLMTSSNGYTYLHCVPIYFYGTHNELLTKLYKGLDLWLEVSHQFPDHINWN